MKRTTLAILFAMIMAAAASAADETTRVVEAAAVVEDVRPQIALEYWSRAHCIVVVPGIKKAAFIFGGEYGKGVMSCRAGESWTAPLFMELAKGSWGFQAGAEQVDLVLLVMNESGVEKLLQNKVNLGADASMAAGPVGRGGALGTDAALTAEILSYSRSRGLFAGLDLSGGVLRPDDEANRAIYGRNASPRRILASREISAPPEASAFLRALNGGQHASAPATSSSSQSNDAERHSTSRSAADDGVRAQLVEAQQTVDRLLADTTPAAVGTTGAANEQRPAGTVTVDRARLIQLRQQIEAAILALSRR